MKIIDKYILKKYLTTFAVMLLLFAPIGIVIDVSEKINKMIENKIPIAEILIYYFNFTIYFTNLLFPIFLFLSVIWFTSKLANDTEIIAILSSGISFTRFLRPFIIGASIISVFILLMGFFVVPKASEGFNNFRYTYLRGDGKQAMRGDNTDVYRQVSNDEYIYVNSFDVVSKTAYNFSYEKFKKDKLDYKISASRIQWNPKTKNYTMYDYVKRTVGEIDDKIEKADKKDAKFNFDLEDLTPVVYIAETLNLGKLNQFIDKEKKRGSSNINVYMVVLYKKYSIPVSAFILTIIAVAVSSMKRRGGMGLSLAIGIAVAFSFVFFDKIFGTLAEKSSFPPLLAVWFPNIVFGILAIFFYYEMRNGKLTSYLNLHLIVFIWGFTAILGALISIQADALVWYRMLFAGVFLFLFILFKKQSFRIPIKEFFKLIFVGLLIAVHWIFFFKAIHISNVSITLSVFSLGAFFTSILEPIFYGRKVLWYEVLFGLAIIAGLALILQVEINYFEGMMYALASIIIGVLFTLMNGKLIEKHEPSVITFYEFLAGVFFISIYFLFENKFNVEFFILTSNDWILLFILSSVCTAYAFTASVKVMRKLSPYTIMLTTSLEPVYGIILAFFIIGGKEKMSIEFYIGAILIVITVILNAVLKHYLTDKE